MEDHPHAPIAPAIYWMLPGPRAFIDSISHGVSHGRAVLVEVQGRGVIGFWYAFEQALLATHTDSEQPLRLTVEDGSHIESDVGHHLGLATISPSQLAQHMGIRHRKIVLTPRGARAAEKCRAFLLAFAEASQSKAEANRVTLVVVRADADPVWPSAGLTKVSLGGALSAEEMTAYVGMRMIGRRGPGSTALTQHLVAEFAGYDASFAEELMRLSEHELLGLPQSLALVAHRMTTSDTVWRESRLETGSVALVDGDVKAHVLHEWHLASHEGPMREAATRSIASRYWRAALRALMPWLEERRHHIIKILEPELERYLSPTGGMRIRYSARGTRSTEVPISELECNDIISMKVDRDNPFIVSGSRQMTAVDVCFKVTKVRNELAHLRCPEPAAIMELVQSMDQLLY